MDFEKFYNDQSEYSKYRMDEKALTEYKSDVAWKVNNLADILSKSQEKSFENVLEIGCAFGYLLDEFSKRIQYKQLLGLDISTENVEFGRKLYPYINFMSGTLENVSFKDYLGEKEKFDLVILSDIVEHIPDDLGFMKRVMEISKYVILNLPLEKSFITRNREYGEKDPSGHLRSYNIKDGLSLVKEAGFKVERWKVENPLFTARIRDNFLKKQIKKAREKSAIRRLFWESYYAIILPVIISLLPFIAVKIYGANLFIILESKDSCII